MNEKLPMFTAGVIYGAGFAVACYWALKVAHFIWERIERRLFMHSMVYVPPPPKDPAFYKFHFGRCDIEARMQGNILQLEGRTNTFDDFELYLDQHELTAIHHALGELIEQAPFPTANDDEAQT